MGFMDKLKELTQPYDDDEDFFEGADPSFKPQPPEPRTDGYYKKRPCPEMVFCAAGILEEYLSREG